MTMLQAALRAQARGFHIFPVARNAKVPHRLAGEWGAGATNDAFQIVQFWSTADPYANIGVACKNSELLVIDCDQAKEDWKLKGTEWGHMHAAFGPRVSGEDLLDEMHFQLAVDDEEAGGYDETYSVDTRSGGLHLYYRWPAHWPRISQASPVKGLVDVRGNGGQWGGYVLGEGSRVDGGDYTVRENYPVKLPPKWIRLLVAEKPQQPKIQRVKGLMQPGAISHSGLVTSVRNAGEGNRNNALHWAARTMYTERASEADCLATLGPAAEAAGLGYAEIERTIQSAYAAQAHKEGA